MVFLLVMKIVEKVIYPIITKPKSVTGFHLNAIACQGNHYGMVTSIDSDSYRPITIAWDKNEPFAYTEDEIRVLKIKVVEQLLPQKTIVSMPPGTMILLENEEQIKLDRRQEFLVENKSDRAIIIQNIATNSTVNLVKLSDHVAYEISSDRKLLKAYIGFRTKKLAKAWLKPLKHIVGRLSNLKDCRREDKRHFLEKKWQYSVEKFRHKKRSRRLQDLEIIAQLDLEKPP